MTRSDSAACNSDFDSAPISTKASAPESDVKITTTVFKSDSDNIAALPSSDSNQSSVQVYTEEDIIPPTIDEVLDFCQTAQSLWERRDLDNALAALDNAYALILKIDTQDNPDLTQQKEDLRFTISKRILEIYASRNIVATGKHNAIPVYNSSGSLNQHVQAEVNRLATGVEREFFIQSYRRSGKYRSMILAKLKAAGIPEELSWLPLIESGFKVSALSSARALGMWQFIPSTGYKFGLKRDQYIDERMDPEKATTAAIAYLKELHSMFGDWSTVLAAYNCGEGRVLREIRRQNLNYLDNFWDLYERLPRETARYVPRFLATIHIINHLDEYGIDSIQPSEPVAYETIEIRKQIHLKNAANVIGSSFRLLKELNPELKYSILPPGNYSLKIPFNTGDVLLASIDNIPTASIPVVRRSSRSKSKRSYIRHKVRSGQTVSSIARRYHCTIKEITRTNKIRKNRISVGQVLKIPRKAKYKKKGSRRTARYSGRSITYVVKTGDSLWNIAKKYGTTPKQIKKRNKLNNSRISAGQKLKISSKKSQKSKVHKKSKTYKVKNGDVPLTIAKRYKMPLNRLLKINRLTSRSKIYPGQKLYVD
ncbi:LysM peptidoglycan-binding domain-containing protein [Desulfobacterales bacterium HSG16]|nr:LysM peptidoglycan-binding domain-containing protein [Desulfobacterales bacterium HSG16]